MATRETEPARDRGFTLIEMLVAMAMFATVGAALTSFFISSSRLRSMAEIRLETHQALTATVDTLAREIRLAGVCFTTAGQFVSLQGVNNGTQDQLTVRLGLTANQSCVRTSLGANAAQGSRTLNVTSAQGFAVNTAGYVTDGNAGDFFTVTAISGLTLTTNTNWSRLYPQASSTVYAMQERIYALDPANARGPVLTLARDRRPAEIFADGITALNIQYRLVGGALSNLPPDDATWRLVTEVLISVTARSLQRLPGGAFHQEDATLTVKPRNLQP